MAVPALVDVFSDDDGGTSPQFTGVVDSCPTSRAEFTLTIHANIYGAALGDVTDVNSYGEVRFDEALLGDDEEDVANTPRVEDLHVRNRMIEVSE